MALSVMADSEAKIRYERYVFTPTFTRLLLEVDKTLETHLGSTVRNRRFVVYGGAGKIIGGAVVDALKSLKFSTAVVDPALSRPDAFRIANSWSASAASFDLKLNRIGWTGSAASPSSTVGILPTPLPRSGKLWPPSAV